VFARGQPELLGISIDTRYEVDVIEFLWACLAQFEDDTAGDGTDTVYRPRRPDLCSVLEARARMERLLAGRLKTAPFACFLPRVPVRKNIPGDIPLWRRSAADRGRGWDRHLSRTIRVRVAAGAMADRNVGSVMVVEDGKLVGIFTERDALVRLLAAGLDPVTTQLSVVVAKKSVDNRDRQAS
jgi:hypothetical protein